MLILVALQSFLLLLLLTTTPFSTFGHVNITELTENPIAHNSTSVVKLPLAHRDKLARPNDYRDRFDARMKRDAARVATLTQRLSVAASGTGNLEAHVYPLSSEYYVQLGIGSPPTGPIMLIDTGSDLTWVRTNCDKCFKPESSTSFKPIPCGSSTCIQASNNACEANNCIYEIKYDDGTDVKGTMAWENITIGNTTVAEVPIGCQTTEIENPLPAEFGGLLALGRGSISFANQKSGQLGSAFSYCLGKTSELSENSEGWLEFGRATFPNNATWASLDENMHAPQFYYIKLLDLGVGGDRLNLPEDMFQINADTGYGGAMIDTGTTITRLPQAAYEALRDKFKEKMTTNLPSANLAPGEPTLFDTCYRLSENETDKAPSISFYFSGGLDPNNQPSLTVGGEKILVLSSTEADKFCFAFSPISPIPNLTIIGKHSATRHPNHYGLTWVYRVRAGWLLMDS